MTNPHKESQQIAVDAIAKTIWLAEFGRAFRRVPSDPWENQAEPVKEGHRNTARKLVEAGLCSASGNVRATVIEECARVAETAKTLHVWLPVEHGEDANHHTTVHGDEIAKLIRALSQAPATDSSDSRPAFEIMKLQARPADGGDWIDIFPAQLGAMVKFGNDVRALEVGGQHD